VHPRLTAVIAVVGAVAALSGGEPAAGAPAARTVVWALGDGADGSAEGRRLAR
jgi:hypothetical protein